MRVMVRSHSALALAVLAGAVALLAAGAAQATAPTTITFEELDAGTELRDQYASTGVRFGAVADFPVDIEEATDCGAPVVQGTTSKVAQVPPCEGIHAAVVAFQNPRKEVSVLAGAGGTSDGPRYVQLMAFDRSGQLLERAQSALNSVVSISRDSPDIGYAAVKQIGEQTGLLFFDNLTFDHLGDPLLVSGRNVTATVGVERTDNVAHFTDADPTAVPSDYRARIDWGDGQASDGRIARAGSGYDVFGTHTYTRAGSFTVRTTVEKVNGVRASASSVANVTDRPGFALSAEPSTRTVSQGQSAVYKVVVSPLAGFLGAVSLSLSGASGTFSPASVTVPGTSTLTVVTSRATAPATYPLTITGTSGGVVRTAQASLVVTKVLAPVLATFAAPRRTTGLGPTLLNARGSTGVRFRWDLNGDGRDDVACDGDEPYLSTRLYQSGARAIRLTAVAADGRTSVVRRTVSVAGRRPSSAILQSVAQVAACGRVGPVGGRPVGCAGTVHFGVIEARGCLKHVTRPDEIPPAERTILDALIRKYNESPQLRTYVAEFCRELNLRNCRRTETIVDRRETRPVLEASDVYVSSGKVMINGIELRPRRSGAIVLFPQLGRVVSSNAAMWLDDIRVPWPEDGFSLDVEGRGTLYNSIFGHAGRAPLFSFAAPSGFKIGGFGLDGEIELTLVRGAGVDRFTEVKMRIKLPPLFNFLGGDPPSGEEDARADNDRGLVLDRLSITVPEVNLGAVRFTNLTFAYSASGNSDAGCARHWWKATGNVFLGTAESEGGFKLSPPPSQNGIAFCAGEFKSAGGALVFGGPIPRPQLFPGVFLNEVNFAVALNPTLVRGGAKLSVADVTDADGVLLTIYPSPDAPYVLTREDAGPQLAQLAGRRLVSTTVALGGVFGMPFPIVGRIPFANAYLMYSFPDYVAFGGAARFIVPGAALNLGVDGELAVGTKLFSTHSFGELCIAGLACLLRAEAWVTSTGVVACGSIGGELHPGVGYRWGDTWPTIWLVDGCKPSRYWVQVRPPSRRDASATSGVAGQAQVTFTVARGEPTQNVRLPGGGGAPVVQVRGPDGETVSTAGRDFAAGRTIRILRQEQGKVTWIGVENARPGTYVVTTLPGSPAIAGVSATRPAAAGRISASVTGSGAKRTLRYVVPALSGRRVTFFERGAGTFRRLGSVSKGRGAIRFTPGRGPGGLRQILARVVLQGVPTPELVLARFRAQGPVRAGRPGSAQVRRQRTSIVASWRRAANASGYVVVVRQRNGVQRVVRVPSGRRSIRVLGIPLTQSGTVTVRALGPLAGWGKPAMARFRATKREPTRLRPFSELRRPARS